MTAIQVTSEINKLEKVLVHRPGDELLNLTPNTLEELLFDDIPDLKLAQEEHDRFTDILRDNGVEVLYLEDLVAEALDQNEGLREQFLDQYLEETGVTDEEILKKCRELLEGISDTKEFVEKTMAGITLLEIGHFSEEELKTMGEKGNYLAINPMPNLYFTRDPFATIGNGVSINTMFAETRNRETIYGDYVMRYHNDYKGQVPNYYGRGKEYHIEGGDELIISDTTLLIGISQRTQYEAIQELAKNIFFGEEESKIEKIYALNIPVNRAFMHLDTVFTRIDHDAFTFHPGIMQTLKIYKITKGDNDLNIEEKSGEFEEILAEIAGVEKVRLIPCGNGDPIAAEREQWNDGSNTLTIAPGEVVVYKRNTVTNAALKEAGIKVHELDASNLTVGRGGPRCMSMPFVRSLD